MLFEDFVVLDTDAEHSLEEEEMTVVIVASGTSILVFSLDSVGAESDNDVTAATAVIFSRSIC